MPLLSSTTSRNKSVTLRHPTITHLLLRPVNLAVLAAGLAVGILLAALTTQPPLTASAQTSLCGNDICEGPVEQNYNCSDCLPTCDGANWCTDGIGASPAGCPDYTEYDDWAYVPGVDYCSSSGCCVSVEGDDNPPVTTAILDGTRGLDDWFVSPVTVTLSVSDDWSGVFSTNLDGEPYTGPQLYDAEGATTIAYQSYDNAGNLEPLKTTTFYIDTVPPATTVVVPTNNSWVSGVFTIAGISTDATSGLAGVDVSFDQGLTWLPATGGEVWAYPWDTRTLGVNIIQVRGRDQAGNNETPIVLAVSIDNSGPFFEVGPFPGEYCFTCSGPLTFTMTAFDEQSRINNSAIVVKQSGKDVRVLQAPGGELRNTPVVWDGKDSQGQLVPPGDYQLLFYTANYAGMFGSFGSGIQVTDVLPSVPPAAAPVVSVDPPEDAPGIVSSSPPTPTTFIPASGITSGPVSIAPQVAAVPQAGVGGSTSSLTGATGGIAGGKTGAAATGATALLVAAAAYIAAQQATGNLSLGKKLAELAGQWKPSAKPAAPPVGKVAPPQAPPPPPPRPKPLRWNEIPRVMPPPPPPKPVYSPAPQPKVAASRGRPIETPVPGKSSPIKKLWPGHGGALGAFGGSRPAQTRPQTSTRPSGLLGGLIGGITRGRSTQTMPQPRPQAPAKPGGLLGGLLGAFAASKPAQPQPKTQAPTAKPGGLFGGLVNAVQNVTKAVSNNPIVKTVTQTTQKVVTAIKNSPVGHAAQNVVKTVSHAATQVQKTVNQVKKTVTNAQQQVSTWAKNTGQQIAKTANSALTTVKNVGSAAWEWMDKHQEVTSVGVGIGVGIAAVAGAAALAAAGVVALPAIAVAGIALGVGALAMGGLTIALNKTHNRDWNQHILHNMVLAGGTAGLIPLALGPLSSAGGYLANMATAIGSQIPLVGGLFSAPIVSNAIAATWAAGMTGILHLGVQGLAKTADPTLSPGVRDSGKKLLTIAGGLGILYLGATQGIIAGGQYVKSLPSYQEQQYQTEGIGGGRPEAAPKFTEDEQDIVDYLAGQGHDVGDKLSESGPGRHGEAMVDGALSEFKSLDPGASSATVRNVVNESLSRGGQAPNMVIDARDSGLTEEEALTSLYRVRGILPDKTGALDTLKIIGDGFEILGTYTEQADGTYTLETIQVPSE